MWKCSSKTGALLGLFLWSLYCCCAVEGYNHFDNYVPYPHNALGLLNQTVHDLAAQAPKVEILTLLPARDLFQHLQEVAIRNSYQNPLFHMEVQYYMTDGLDLGCRKVAAKNTRTNTNTSENSSAGGGGGRITDHVPTTNKHPWMCRIHCTHKGRYCPAFPLEQLEAMSPHRGHDLVLEVLRRLCLGETLPQGFSNPDWFEYLAGIQENKCLEPNHNLTICSRRVLTQRLPDFPTGPDSPFGKCFLEAEHDTDTPNPMLERSLDFSQQIKNAYVPSEDLPIIKIGGIRYRGRVRADSLLNAWCSHFRGGPRGGGVEKPISCDFCPKCNNGKNCLWKLSCDRHHFDLGTYKDPKHPNRHRGINTTTTTPPTLVAEVEEVAEEVAEDVAIGTGLLLLAGAAIGSVGVAVLWFLVELKRKRAVAEVVKELPMEGFKDSVTEVSSLDENQQDHLSTARGPAIYVLKPEEEEFDLKHLS